MELTREYGRFNIDTFQGVDLERLGKGLIYQILTHFGMERYDRVGIKDFDLSKSEVGKLTDECSKVLMGVNPRDGIREYRETIKGLIEVVLKLETSNLENSVTVSLKKSFARELQRFTREVVEFDELWEL